MSTFERSNGQKFLSETFQEIEKHLNNPHTPESEKNHSGARGINFYPFVSLLAFELGIDNEWIPALDFMRLTSEDEPDIELTGVKIDAVLREQRKSQIYITQGFICRNATGQIDNLKQR